MTLRDSPSSLKREFQKTYPKSAKSVPFVVAPPSTLNSVLERKKSQNSEQFFFLFPQPFSLPPETKMPVLHFQRSDFHFLPPLFCGSEREIDPPFTSSFAYAAGFLIHWRLLSQESFFFARLFVRLPLCEDVYLSGIPSTDF